MSKTVLVELVHSIEMATNNHKRPVAFSGGKDELIAAIKVKSADVLPPGGDVLYLHISDEVWGAFIYLERLGWVRRLPYHP